VFYLVASKGKSLETSCTIVEIIFPCPYEFIVESKIDDLFLSLQKVLPPTSQRVVVMDPNVLNVFNAVFDPVLDTR
jgi:hypothetical protein